MEKENMIAIRNLTKRYGGLTVYDDFNLTLERNKIVCLLGDSGSGKTTLLNCIANLTPFEGSIPKLKCSYVFQFPRLVPNLTVTENLKLVCKDENAIKNMLSKLRLENKAKNYPAQLSGGQAQRVALARAFLFGGDVMLMDEPFSSLDLKLKKEITELFLSLWENDKRTVVCVTHDVDEAISLAHRILILRDGKIVHDATPALCDDCECELLRKDLTARLI